MKNARHCRGARRPAAISTGRFARHLSASGFLCRRVPCSLTPSSSRGKLATGCCRVACRPAEPVPLEITVRRFGDATQPAGSPYSEAKPLRVSADQTGRGAIQRRCLEERGFRRRRSPGRSCGIKYCRRHRMCHRVERQQHHRPGKPAGRALPGPSAAGRGAGRGGTRFSSSALGTIAVAYRFKAAFIARRRLLRRGCGTGPSGRKLAGGSTPPRLHQLRGGRKRSSSLKNDRGIGIAPRRLAVTPRRWRDFNLRKLAARSRSSAVAARWPRTDSCANSSKQAGCTRPA